MGSNSKRDRSSESDGGRKRNRSSSEIPEGVIKDYLAKKTQKKALRVAKKLKTKSVSGYSNDSNPFGDSNLTEMFVWWKKIEKEIHEGVSLNEFTIKAEKRKTRERIEEIEKVKKRREERATEKARHEEEIALLARERVRSEFHDWEKKEEEFNFDQSKVKSEIRLREGRAKPIDILWNQLDDCEPYMVFKGLSVKDMEELRDDMKMYSDLDLTRFQYWEALIMLCDWELGKRDQERGLHACVEDDVRKLLNGKTHEELLELQLDIESQLRTGSAKVVEYWEALLKRLHIYKAKAYLKEIHAQRRHIQQNVKVIHGFEEMNLSDAEEAIDPEEDKHQKQGNVVFDKHLPRKPKYLNRVHTGFEWSKYNRTHYDHDNPPPKTIQGYKFTLFYPDLIDNLKAPFFTIEQDGISTETCIIRFQAGPPYEDITFRIVNKEWESSYKKGFKSTFQDGILHLHFNFKRVPYRR